MPTISPLRPSDLELDQLLLRALETGRPVKHRVWAFLGSAEHPYRAEPLLITVRITAEDGALVWHPVKGRTIGEGAREVYVEVLRGDRVWWGPWTRKFAAARVRVEAARTVATVAVHGLAGEVERVLAGLDAHEKAVLWDRFGGGGVDGDRTVRVIATFSPPRGYEEA